MRIRCRLDVIARLPESPSPPNVLPWAVAALVGLGIVCEPYVARGAEPELTFTDCPLLDPVLTRDLLAIELKTLGVSAGPGMLWSIRCHESRATLQFRDTSGKDGENAPGLEPELIASSELDLSATDAAALPRLIAIAASELVGQERSHSQNTRKSPTANAQAMVRLQPVAFAVKTNSTEGYLAAVGVGLVREGNPGATLISGNLRLDRRLGFGFLSLDLRGERGRSSIGNVNVKWRSGNAALGAGATLNLRVADLDTLAGLRLGWLALEGETSTPELTGRSLAGFTGGPFVALRLRRSLGKKMFMGLGFELGMCLFPLRGTYDGVSPLLNVDGPWTSAILSVGREF